MNFVPDVLVLLGGPLEATGALRAAARAARLVIAADGGVRHAAALGVEPALWVGDFDSVNLEDLTRWRHLPRMEYPRDKDATDAELAAQAALKARPRSLLFAGGLGGELDHELGNLTLAVALARRGVRTALSSGPTWAFALVPPGLELDLEAGTPFSVVPLADLEGLTIRGGRWELEDARLPLGSGHGLRNAAAGGVDVRLAGGYGLFVVDATSRAS
ncbi:thiamine diphosphokinase [Oceanithermus desulfurans]